MKRIEIADQPRLGFVRVVGVTVDGIRYRLFRAAVTVAVIAVAVAFLMNILSESLIKREVAARTRGDIEARRLVQVWVARLSEPGSLEELLREIAAAVPGGDAYREAAALSGLSGEEMEAMARGCRTAAVYLDFFNSLDYARRRSLVYTAAGTGIFERLRSGPGRQAFLQALNELKSIRFVTSIEDLTAFLERWPDTRRRVKQLREGRRQAIEKVAAAPGGRDLLTALAEGSIGETVRSAGFRFDPGIETEVARQARLILDGRTVEKAVSMPEGRQLVARRRDMLPADVTAAVVWDFLSDAGNARWYRDRLVELDLPGAELSADHLTELAEQWRQGESLVRAEHLTMDMGTGWLGLGRRMSWLLMVSMLVCGIGISNAMLMTVTERFREIATMKCLGALDGFIMVVFVLESCFLGFVGGIFGSILGNLIGLGRMCAAFGARALLSIPFADLSVGTMSAVGVGIALAAIAAVYPALKAARLAPMEAMRIE